jgi:hypothetical protein
MAELKVMLRIVISTLTVSLIACQVLKDLSSLRHDDPKFELPPTVIKRNDSYYLRYKLRNPSTGEVENRLILQSKRVGDKGYFFLSGPISFREYYNVKEVKFPKKISGAVEGMSPVLVKSRWL